MQKHGNPADKGRRASWPTFLGGGYWEWVWGAVGDAEPGKGYMHRPSSWPLLQFAPAGADPKTLCGNIEFPARHVAKSIYMAQREHALIHNGSFAPQLKTLINDSYCNLMLTTSDTCDILALEYAEAHPEIFDVGIVITENATTLTRHCTARPCYNATVRLTVPAGTDLELDYDDKDDADDDDMDDDGSARSGKYTSNPPFACDVPIFSDRVLVITAVAAAAVPYELIVGMNENRCDFIASVP